MQLVGQGLVVSPGDSTALCREGVVEPEVHFRAVSAAADLVVQEQAKAWRLPAGRWAPLILEAVALSQVLAVQEQALGRSSGLPRTAMSEQQLTVAMKA